MKAVRTAVIATAVSLILVSCAKTTTGNGGTEAIPYPTGADQVTLRVAQEGGFIAPLSVAERVPQLSMFGDGTVITEGAQPAIYPGQALPPILTQTLTADGIQLVLKEALAAGLGEQHADLTGMGSVEISDMPTTVFTFNANGVSTTLKVYALGAGDQKSPHMSEAEFQLRSKLAALAIKLGSLDQWLPHSAISQAKPYEANGSRVYVSAYRADATLSEPSMTWPLSTPLDTFGASGESGMGAATPVPGARCGTVTGSEWSSKLQPLAAKANQLTPWISGGTRYSLTFRLLLPDEHTC